MVDFWQYLVFLDLVLAICDRFTTVHNRQFQSPEYMNVKKNYKLTKMKKVTF